MQKINKEEEMKETITSLQMLAYIAAIMASTALMVSFAACLIMLLGAR